MRAICFFIMAMACAKCLSADNADIVMSYGLEDSKIVTTKSGVDIVRMLFVFYNKSDREIVIKPFDYYPNPDVKVKTMSEAGYKLYNDKGEIVSPVPLPDNVFVTSDGPRNTLILPPKMTVAYKQGLSLAGVFYVGNTRTPPLKEGIYRLHLEKTDQDFYLIKEGDVASQKKPE